MLYIHIVTWIELHFLFKKNENKILTNATFLKKKIPITLLDSFIFLRVETNAINKLVYGVNTLPFSRDSTGHFFPFISIFSHLFFCILVNLLHCIAKMGCFILFFSVRIQCSNVQCVYTDIQSPRRHAIQVAC